METGDGAAAKSGAPFFPTPSSPKRPKQPMAAGKGLSWGRVPARGARPTGTGKAPARAVRAIQAFCRKKAAPGAGGRNEGRPIAVAPHLREGSVWWCCCWCCCCRLLSRPLLHLRLSSFKEASNGDPRGPRGRRGTHPGLSRKERRRFGQGRPPLLLARRCLRRRSGQARTQTTPTIAPRRKGRQVQHAHYG